MSLRDLGKNDVSEETQTFKDRLASRDTENAGLRSHLMRREAELEELQATLNETVYKLSREAERALQLEEEVSARSSELKTERISLRNTELALQSAQEKLKAEERAKRELESTLDTISLHSQTTSAEHQSIQREKRALESRVRELECIVQMHEAKGPPNIPRKNGRSRSSSVSNFHLPAVEQELNGVKAQLLARDSNLRTLEQKLARAQDDLVKAENARISIDKASQKRISELLSVLERKEEELELLRETDNAGEREEELMKRIDEDAARIAALEKSLSENQATQARFQKLQSQLKAECDKVHRSEDLQNRLLYEKEELLNQYKAVQCEIEEGRELLMARELQINELETKYAHLTQLDAQQRKEISSSDAEHPSLPFQRSNGVPICPDQSALADHIQTLLQAIDRLRNERDGLKRALEFSEIEYRITTEGFQTRIGSLTRQLTESTHDAVADKNLSNVCAEQRMKQLTSCAAAFTIVISNLQTRLDLSEGRLSTTTTILASSQIQLNDALGVIDNQKQLLDTNVRERDDLLHKLDIAAKELTESNEERGRLRLQLVDAEGQAAAATECAEASEAAREEAYHNYLSAEQRFASLNQNCQDVESERNSLTLQITNLQDDLACARDELFDAQTRYNTLHAQQLSAMPTSQVAHALKDRIQELEARIIHYMDQIGDHQHDIRRLEANVKIHEERIGEMTSELELLVSEKEAMVEDCAQAREARDDAVERLEAIEEEAERLQQQLQQANKAKETEISAVASMMANLESENQQTITRLLDMDAKNAGFVWELESLREEHQRLNEQLNIAIFRSGSLELENSRKNTEMRQAVISLAVIYRVYRDFAQQHQRSRGHIASLRSQLVDLRWELGQRDSLVDSMEQETQGLHQRPSDIPIATPLRLQTTAEELTRARKTSQQHGHDLDNLRKSLQEKEEELMGARSLLEDTKSHFSKVEAELLERIAKMSTELQEHTGRAEDVVCLQAELDDVRNQLANSQENFADLEKVYNDVIHEFTSAKEVFQHRLADTGQQISTLSADHQQNLAAIEAKYTHDADVLASNLEDREQEIDELRQQLHSMSEVHGRTEGKLHEELKSYEVHHSLMKDLENDLRGTITELRQRLSRAENEILVLQEERQSLQVEITGLRAEGQRSASLIRYLENQVRESEDACMLLKEDLRRLELSLAESEKTGKTAEFSHTLQTTQHEKVIAALRHEIATLQSGPELHSALADLEEKNREMDDLLRTKCQEIEEYDDRILETLKINKKLTSKVDSLTRKAQALQTKLSSMKNQSRDPVAEAVLSKNASLNPSSPIPMAVHTDSSHIRENSTSLASRSKTPESRIQAASALPLAHTPNRPSEPSVSERSAGRKRPAPDDDERDSVPAEGHYSTDASLRNGPTPRMRRTHGHPAGFTPVRGASLRNGPELGSPGRRVNTGMMPSEVITDVTNNPRGISGQGDRQVRKRSWLGKIRGGADAQPANSRMGTFGGQ